MLCTIDPVCKAFNHGNVNICFNHGVGKRMIGMWMGDRRGGGDVRKGYEKEGKGMSVREIWKFGKFENFNVSKYIGILNTENGF